MKIQYSRNRYYDPETGRFLTQDPLGITPNASYTKNPFNILGQYADSLSLYEYVHSNPVMGADAWGLLWSIEPGVPDDDIRSMIINHPRIDLSKVCDDYTCEGCCEVGAGFYKEKQKREFRH